MRRSSRLLSLVSLVAAAACAPASGAAKPDSATMAADMQAIGHARDAFVAAFKAGDVAAITALYTSDGLTQSNNQPTGSGPAGIYRRVQGPVRPFQRRRLHADAREDGGVGKPGLRHRDVYVRRYAEAEGRHDQGGRALRRRAAQGCRRDVEDDRRHGQPPDGAAAHARCSQDEGQVESDYNCPTSGPHSSTSFLYAGSSYLDGRNHFA